MRRLVLTRKATADLRDIWVFGEDRWGEEQAERYARALDAAIKTVVENPLRATSCENVRPGLRRIRCQSHVIYVVIRDDDVRVIRVLHQRMDAGRHL